MKIRFALIGTGYHAHRHAKAIMQLRNTELVGVFSRTKDRTKSFAYKYNIKSYYSFEDIINDKSIDAIDIVTLNNLHSYYGILSAKAGKHVIIEKPIDVSVKNAEELIKECKKYNVKLSVISQHRFDSCFKWLKKEIDNGVLGKLFLGNVSIKWNRNKNYYESSAWRKKTNTSGGGVLIAQAIHYIDLLLWFFGPVESVYGKINTMAHKIEVEDVAMAILKFKSGALATIESTTCVVRTLNDRFEIHGDKGSVVLDGNKVNNFIKSFNLINKLEQMQKKLISLVKFKRGFIKDQIKDFANSIILDIDPLVTGKAGLDALKVIIAVYRSSNENKEINLKDTDFWV